jgi:hypothetical protein
MYEHKICCDQLDVFASTHHGPLRVNDGGNVSLITRAIFTNELGFGNCHLGGWESANGCHLTPLKSNAALRPKAATLAFIVTVSTAGEQ